MTSFGYPKNKQNIQELKVHFELILIYPRIQWKRLDKINVHKINNLHFFDIYKVSCLWFMKYYQIKENWKNNAKNIYKISSSFT
jgi:hypothetical protein